MNRLTRGLIFFFFLVGSVLAFGDSGKLTIYWIDTEGGAATLIITPSGRSMLVDAGDVYPQDRDAKRIYETAKQAGLSRIDVLLTTHYHSDHVGGTPALAKLIPIDHYYDHGELAESGPFAERLYKPYAALAAGKRILVRPGDQIPLTGAQVTVVAADGKTISGALKGNKPNALCNGAQQKPADKTENQRSIGFLLTYGKFTFLNLADLTWDKEMELACPVNKLGTVTLMQATHHGFYGDLSGAPALIWALDPQVVVVNNGARKGLGKNAYETIRRIPDIKGIWQLHQSAANDDAHNTSPDMIANSDPASDGHWIKAIASEDGTVTVTNGRNGLSKTYTVR